MKTIGGYEITEFKQLESPQEKHPFLKPNIFSGVVNDPITKKKVVVLWNEDGEYNNSITRKDCNIKIGR